MKDILIVGAGGLGREILALIKNINTQTPTWNVKGFIDDGKQPGEIVNGVEVAGGMSYLQTIQEHTAVVIAISLPEVRKKLHESITNPQVYFPSIVHPRAYISDEEFVQVGQGCILCANTLLTTNITLGDFVLVNAGAILNHDAVVGSYSTIMPGVNISTGAHVAEGCYIGTGSKISRAERLPAWQKLPAGTIIA